jgi:hypothetical protein
LTKASRFQYAVLRSSAQSARVSLLRERDEAVPAFPVAERRPQQRLDLTIAAVPEETHDRRDFPKARVQAKRLERGPQQLRS